MAMIQIVELLTCSTALIRSRSSVGFHRPRSLVICRGCLLFFTLLVMGGGFITMARGGVRVVPDFVTWHHVSKVHKSSIAPLQALLQPLLPDEICGFHGHTNLFFLTRWKFIRWTADRLYDRRAFDSARWLHKTAFYQLIIKLLPLYRPGGIILSTLLKHCTSHLFTCVYVVLPTKLCYCTAWLTVKYIRKYIKPGRTSTFGNSTAKCLCCCPFHIFYSERLFVLWPALGPWDCHRCTNHRVACLHLLHHKTHQGIIHMSQCRLRTRFD